MPIRPLLDDPRLHRLMPWLCGLVAFVLASKALIGGYGDLGIYLTAAQELTEGGFHLYRERTISDPFPYPHAALVPFALLQQVLGDAAIRWLWCAFLGLCTALLLRATARAMTPLGGLRPWQWVVFGVLFQRCIAQNLTHGQISLVVAALIAVGVTDLQSGRDRRAGVWLGIAASIKLTPLLFLPALPLMRRGHAAVVMALTTLALVLLLPWPWCGTGEHLRHLEEFVRFHVAGFRGEGLTMAHTGTGPSIHGTLDYLLQPKPVDKAGRTVNLFAISDGALQAVRLLWSALLGSLLIAWFWKARRRADAPRLALQAAAVEFGMAFFSPLTRVYHLAATLLAFALFCRGPQGRRDGLWWTAAITALFAMTLRQRKLLGETLWRAFDTGALLHLSMVLTLLWLLRHDGDSDHDARS